MARTLYDKIWDEHVVHTEEDGTSVLYIDRHLVHEVTSPQAFEGLRQAGRKVWRVSSIVATADHNTPTTGWEQGYDGITDPISKEQITTLNDNIAEFGAAAFFPFMSQRQGIVHVIGPENGATLPGMTVVCGDSHTSTHGAFGALAHGIGTSEVEHVMATQTLLAKKAKNMLVRVDGQLAKGVTAKDIVLAIIGKIGTAGGTGYTIEFAGSAIRALSMEGRMTVCNMAIEGGARAGLVAVDDTTIQYVQNRPFSPKGVELEQAIAYWQSLKSDDGAHFDAEVVTLERSLQAMLGQRQGATLVNALTAAPEAFSEVHDLRLQPEVLERLTSWRARFGLAIDNALSFLSNPDGIQGHNFTTQVAHGDDRRALQGRLTFVRYSNESEFFIADATVFLSVAADVLDKLGTHITREDVDPEVVSRLGDAVKLIERRTAPRGEE